MNHTSYEKSTPSSLDFNPLTSSIDTGFVAYSSMEYDFDTIDVIVSPGYIVNDGLDYVDISIFSLDTNGNRKPYQEFEISSTYLEMSSTTIITDSEGYAHITATCPSDVVLYSLTYDQILFTGVDDYEYSTFVKIVPANIENSVRIVSSVSSRIIAADGMSNVYITGILLADNIPLANTTVYWRKARYIYDIFNTVTFLDNSNDPGQDSESGHVITNLDGTFTIGPFVAQENTNPGIWFVAIETDGSDQFFENPETIAGDIVYWMEDFDPINYNYEETVGIQEIINFDIDKDLELYSTPTFVLSYYSAENVEVNPQTPAWTPPSWFSLDKYAQYQSGLWGSTPYYIEDYSQIRHDIERP